MHLWRIPTISGICNRDQIILSLTSHAFLLWLFLFVDEPSVYFPDGGGGYSVEKTPLSPLSEPFTQLMGNRSVSSYGGSSIFIGAAGESSLVSPTHETFNLHQHHLQSALNQRQLTNLSPLKTQNSHTDQIVFPDRGIECSW